MGAKKEKALSILTTRRGIRTIVKKRFILISVGLAVIVVAALTFLNRAPEPVQQASTATPIDIGIFKNGNDIFISPQDLKTKLAEKNLIILDGSHPKNYAQGHIPGAINIGFKGLSRSSGKPGDPLWGTILPPEELTKKLESFGVTNDSLIVAYSDTFKGPGAGGRAVWQLRMAGLKNVKLLYGGLEMWRQSGYELSKETPAPQASTGLVLQKYDESYRANLEFVQTNLDSIKIIDVRSEKEFTGDDTSRGEARGGHIKNSVWLEWKDLLNADSTPKSPEEITAILAKVGVGPKDDFVLY